MQFDNKNSQLQQVILGNTLEALVGAVYLDKGYLRCKKFVIDKLIQPHFDLELVIQSNANHKSRIIEWAQRADEHWFGARIPGEVRTVEIVAAGSVEGQPKASSYQEYRGSPPKSIPSAPKTADARIEYILGQRASVMP